MNRRVSLRMLGVLGLAVLGPLLGGCVAYVDPFPRVYVPGPRVVVAPPPVVVAPRPYRGYGWYHHGWHNHGWRGRGYR
jgi:hypothetical protein